jgi:hypothetical protein
MSKIVALRGTDGLGAVGDEPSTGSLVALTFGWLALGGLIGAAFWVTGKEVSRVLRGKA